MVFMGFFLPAMLMIILLAAIIYLVQRGAGQKDYDERQKLARGKAYRDAFWAMAVCMLLAQAVILSKELPAEAAANVMLTALGIGLGVFGISNALRGSWVALNTKPRIVVAGSLACGLLYGRNVFGSHSSVLTEGIYSPQWTSLIFSVVFLLFAAAQLIRLAMDSRSYAEE